MRVAPGRGVKGSEMLRTWGAGMKLATGAAWFKLKRRVPILGARARARASRLEWDMMGGRGEVLGSECGRDSEEGEAGEKGVGMAY